MGSPAAPGKLHVGSLKVPALPPPALCRAEVTENVRRFGLSTAVARVAEATPAAASEASTVTRRCLIGMTTAGNAWEDERACPPGVAWASG